jgi:hypothetical protein
MGAGRRVVAIGGKNIAIFPAPISISNENKGILMRDQRNMTIGCRAFRRRSPVWLFAAAGTSLALLLTGCGHGAPVIDVSAESPSSTVSVPTESADAVHWMDGFCGAVEGFLTDTGAMQTPSTSGDDGQQVISKILGDYAAILDKAIDSLADLPSIADPVGQTAKQTFVGNYTSARDMATSAKTQLDAASPMDFDAQMHAADAFAAAQQKALSAVSPELAIMASPELRTALASAHRCASTS